MYVYIYTYISVYLYIFYICSYLAPKKKPPNLLPSGLNIRKSPRPQSVSRTPRDSFTFLAKENPIQIHFLLYKHYVNISYIIYIYIYV